MSNQVNHRRAASKKNTRLTDACGTSLLVVAPFIPATQQLPVLASKLTVLAFTAATHRRDGALIMPCVLLAGGAAVIDLIAHTKERKVTSTSR